MVLSKCSGGIGDEVKALYVLSGIKARFPNEHLVFYSSIPDWFSDVEGVEIRDIRNHQRSDGPLINPLDFYGFEFEGRATRSQVYLQAFPSRLRQSVAVRPVCNELYNPVAKKVVLCPYANHQERTWSADKMALVERMLNERGVDTVVLGVSRSGGRGAGPLDYSMFQSEVRLDLPVSEINKLLMETAILVSNDSGLAHYASMRGVRVAVIMAQFPFAHVYGDYGTTIQPILPQMACIGCRFRGPNYTEQCRISCAALNGLSARDAFNHIMARLDPEWDGLTIQQRWQSDNFIYDPELEVSVVGGVRYGDGLGKMPVQIARELVSAGIKTSIICPIGLEGEPEDVVEFVSKRNTGRVAPVVVNIDWMNSPHPSFRGNKCKIIQNSMLEADAIKADWVTWSNQASVLVVPDKWVKSVYENSGVASRIEVIPLSLNTSKFKVRKKPVGDVFVFGMSSQFEERKNHRETIEGFLLAFGDSLDYKLKVHGRFGHTYDSLIRDFGHCQNVEITIGELSDRDYSDWWEDLDAYVLPSSGEGFSYSPREAALRGIPSIVSNWSAHCTLVETGGVIGIDPQGLAPAYKFIFDETVGCHAIITVNDIAAAMKQMRAEHSKWVKLTSKVRAYIRKNESTRVVGRRWVELISSI